MVENKVKKKKAILRKINFCVWIVSMMLMIALGYLIYSANILPLKYFLIIIIIFILLACIHGLVIKNKRTRTWVIISLIIFSLFFICCQIFAIVKIGETITFLNRNLNAKYEKNIYNVVVNENSPYNTLKDIEDKTINLVKDFDNMAEVEKELSKKISVNFKYQDNNVELLKNITSNKKLIVLVNSGNYDAMIEIDDTFEKKVKVIGTITIKTKIDNNKESVDISKQPFIVYLSGIDTRSDSLPSRSLSDVNILLAVNPINKQILMIHIPRDFYVKIPGTTGYKDKLTHAGIIGGIELTMKTIEELLDIDLQYYLRVNFNALVNLVDVIGGISIKSDVNYSFKCKTNRNCTFNPGLNSVGGDCALAFARERYAYTSGDRQRGKNQEQVIELIINKVTNSRVIMSNYSNILKALNGTFETNLTTSNITNMVKMQISDMSPWKIESISVDGTSAMAPTYSYPNQNLYVMNPDMKTIVKANAKLQEVLGKNKDTK